MSAPKTSARRKPKVDRSVAGRLAIVVATRATRRPMMSESTCPASARSASDPVRTAPTASMSSTNTASARAKASRRRFAEPWSCVLIVTSSSVGLVFASWPR